MVDVGMAFVDTWVVGRAKACYWLRKAIVGLVGNLGVQEWQAQHGFLLHRHPLYLMQFSHSSKQDN